MERTMEGTKTDRVTTTKECGGGDTHPRDEEYFETGSRSPKSRRHMFGKGGQGTTARRDQLAPASNEE